MNSNIFYICMVLQALAVHRITGVDINNHSDLEDEKKKDHEVGAKVSPLVFLAYGYTDPAGSYDVKYVDLAVAKTANSSIPFDEELAYIALLCPTPTPPEGADRFIIRDVIRKFDPDTDYPMCERYLKPSIISPSFYGSSYYIGFEYKRADREDDEEDDGSDDNLSNDSKSSIDNMTNSDDELDDPYTKFMDEFNVLEGSIRNMQNLRIDYNFNHMMPENGVHVVSAHMHFNNYNEKCQDMELGIEIFKIKIPNFDENIFNEFAAKHPDFSWHQLIPMQDFKGIYSIASTCTHLNYVLLHNRVIGGALRQLETLIRDIADIIGNVPLGSGAWKETLHDSTSNSDKKVGLPSIPTILWKMVSYVDSKERVFSILMVIHNQKTRKICNHERIGKEWGWPEIDGNDNGDPKYNDEGEIGTMYYCLVDETVVEKFSLPVFIAEGETEVPPFNLHDLTVHVNVLDRIRQIKKLRRYRRP